MTFHLRTYLNLILLAVALVAAATPASAGSVSSAKSRLMFAQEDADKGRKDEALAKLDQAEKYLDGLSDAEKAPLAKQINELREKLKNTVDPEISGRIERSIARTLKYAEEDDNPSSAAGKIDQARTQLNSDNAKKDLDPAARKKLEDKLEALSKKIKGDKSSGDARVMTDWLEKQLGHADESAANDPNFARDRLDYVSGMLASDDVRQKLDAPTIQRLRRTMTDTEAKLFDLNKKAALKKAAEPLQQLDAKLATDPYKGVDELHAYTVAGDVESYKARVRDQLGKLPNDDPDRKAIEEKLASAQKKLDAYEAAWAAANFEASVALRWKGTLKAIEGWEDDKYAPKSPGFHAPELDKTVQAVRQIKWFLADKDTAAARKDSAKMPKAAEAIAEAEKVLDAAWTKLDAAFNQWMDNAEKQPRPQGSLRFDIDSARMMGHWADDTLAGSRYHDADVARATKLDQRWKDEIAAQERQYAEALKRLSAEADANWPKVAAAYGAQDGFHPTDAANQKGKTFRFKGVRCRTGWDFDGAYDLTFWVDGQPVGGNFGPKVSKAFADASRQIGDSVNDHIDWEVIATVEGTGTVGRRYKSEVKDDHMNLLATIEGYRPVSCVTVRVLAVHAGPVAAGE